MAHIIVLQNRDSELHKQMMLGPHCDPLRTARLTSSFNDDVPLCVRLSVNLLNFSLQNHCKFEKSQTDKQKEGHHTLKKDHLSFQFQPMQTKK